MKLLRATFILAILIYGMAFAQNDDVEELMNNRAQLKDAVSDIQKDMQKEMGRPEGESFEETVGDVAEDGYVDIPSEDSGEEGSGMLSDLRKKYIPQMKSNPMASKTREEVKAILVTKTQDSNWGVLFKNNPRVFDFVIDFLHHPKAFLYFSSTMAKPEKLRRYFYCFLIVFIITMYWNFKLPKRVPFFRKVLRKIAFSLSGLAINMTSFYMIFQEELKPTAEIFWKHFGFF